MSAEPEPSSPRPLWQRLTLSVEDRRLYPTAPSWDGGYRWFRSANVVDLQRYRSPEEKARIRMVLLGVVGRE